MKIARFADRDNNLWGFVVAEEVHRSHPQSTCWMR